jgi:hypothetical protein
VCQPTDLILDAFVKRGACPKFGRPLHPPRVRLSVGGTYQSFLNGEIAHYGSWASDGSAKMKEFVLSGALAGDKIDVQWGSTEPYNYEFVNVRWDRDDHAENLEAQREDDPQQQEAKTTGTSGESLIQTTGRAIYIIYVEGCENTGLFNTASCDEGWSHPIYVDLLDSLSLPVPLAAVASPVVPGGILDVPDSVMIFADQPSIVGRLCGDKLRDDDGDHEGELVPTAALAHLQSVNRGWSCGAKAWPQLRSDVNAAIGKAEVVSQPGTDIPGWVRTIAGLAVGAAAGAIAGALLGLALTAVFGGLTGLLNYLPLFGAIVGLIVGVVLKDKPGDYDMRLTGMLQMVYRFSAEIDPAERNRLIDELLTVRGPAKERKDFVWISGVPTPALETENHLWMTESSRYLTNNLLAERAKKNGQTVPAEYDNDSNGMTDWVLEGLRLFVVEDFYEFNSRPYAPLIIDALQNLSEFASFGEFCQQVPPPGTPPMSRKCDVARAARNVLDMQAAKFAISSSGLRRAAPFRRQPSFRDYPRFLTNGGDDMAWHYLAYTGGSDFLREERTSHLMEFSDGQLMHAFQSRYRPPVMLTDMLRGMSGGKAQLQRFRGTRRDADVVEVYYREPKFLISAGGKFDSGSGAAGVTSGEDAWALPTTLMPTKEGNDYRDFVRINGHVEESERINTCVSYGFACGLNPAIPAGLPEACMHRDGDWTFINFADNSIDCPFDFGFYVAVYSEDCGKSACDGRFGFFEATEYRSFSAYVADVLAMNKSWSYEYEKINVYQSPTGRRTTFVLDADEDDWGIVDYDLGAGPVKPERRYEKWPVAHGDVMTTPKEACIFVDNLHLKERLILDHVDVNHPRRTIVPLPGRDCTCPLPDHCISPRG